MQAIAAAEPSHDFVVIDTLATDSYLNRLAHAMADTLVTPLNDSFVDFDVLGLGGSGDVRRHRRRLVDGGLTDWIVIRNRLALLGSRNKQLVGEGLSELGLRLGVQGRRRVCREARLPLTARRPLLRCRLGLPL